MQLGTGPAESPRSPFYISLRAHMLEGNGSRERETTEGIAGYSSEGNGSREREAKENFATHPGTPLAAGRCEHPMPCVCELQGPESVSMKGRGLLDLSVKVSGYAMLKGQRSLERSSKAVLYWQWDATFLRPRMPQLPHGSRTDAYRYNAGEKTVTLLLSSLVAEAWVNPGVPWSSLFFAKRF
ncbi:hypothetical protein FOL47_002217 [Perkinsus chesapeaki]|uniref:Uncharacterized protein n=1 Tax=Perkinsus chesapeaki TaxID=330153 RepID=A0A7J6MEU1_PERCH|nr:hypothetical protein FOL47_002217 [Perkinsus chesapeaki]